MKACMVYAAFQWPPSRGCSQMKTIASPVSYTHLDVYKRQPSEVLENPQRQRTRNFLDSVK